MSEAPQTTRVLLVDDDLTVSDVIRKTLSEEGHDVCCCDSAAQAIEQLSNEYFPVVITDLHLPDGSGTRILQHSLKLHPQAAVIVVTGDSHFATATEAIEQGAFDYIPKPFEASKICFLVRQALERHLLLERCHHLQEMALADPLTGLGNRRRFETALKAEVSRSERFGHPLSLLVVDIDDLKSCNDAWGHAAGDQAIRLIGGALATSARQIDLVTRCGGDEFAVLLPETPPEGAAVAAGRYCLAVASIEDVPKGLTISVGRATYPDEITSAAELFATADGRMYEAKRAGGNGYHPE